MIISIVWLIGYLCIACSSPKHVRGWIALTVGIFMIIVRCLLTNENEYGATLFNIRRSLPTEPIIYIFAMMIFKVLLFQYFTLFLQGIENWIIMNNKNNNNNFNNNNKTRGPIATFHTTILRPFCLSFVLAPILSQDVTVSLLDRMYGNQAHGQEEEDSDRANDSTNNNIPIITQAVWRAGSALGSGLTINGNLHNLLLILCLAYDDIGWMEFLSNLALPIMTAFIISLIVLLILGCVLYMSGKDTNESSLHGQYQSIAVMDTEHASEDEKPSMTATEEVSEENGNITGNDDRINGISIESSTANNGTTNTDTEGVSDTNTEEIGTINIHPQSNSSPFIVMVAMIIMFFGYAFGLDVILFTCVVVLVLFWIGWFRNHGPCRQSSISVPVIQLKNPIVSQLDFTILFVYIGVTLLTQSWNDTGVPQLIYNHIGHECFDFSNLTCMTSYVHATYWTAVLVSPMTTVLTLASTFPYNAPYYWLQFSLGLSMASMTRSILQDTFWYHIQKFKKSERGMKFLLLVLFSLLVVAIGVPILCLKICVPILSYIHNSPECSERLGECDMY